MVENPLLCNSFAASTKQASDLLSRFLHSKREHGVELTNLTSFSSSTRVKLAEEKEMTLSLIIAGLPDETLESSNSAIKKEKKDKKDKKHKKDKHEHGNGAVLDEENGKIPDDSSKKSKEPKTVKESKRKDKRDHPEATSINNKKKNKVG